MKNDNLNIISFTLTITDEAAKKCGFNVSEFIGYLNKRGVPHELYVMNDTKPHRHQAISIRYS